MPHKFASFSIHFFLCASTEGFLTAVTKGGFRPGRSTWELANPPVLHLQHLPWILFHSSIRSTQCGTNPPYHPPTKGASRGTRTPALAPFTMRWPSVQPQRSDPWTPHHRAPQLRPHPPIPAPLPPLSPAAIFGGLEGPWLWAQGGLDLLDTNCTFFCEFNSIICIYICLDFF